MGQKPYWPNDTVYFLTGTTCLHYPYFKENEQKQILLTQIKKVEQIIDPQLKPNDPLLKQGRSSTGLQSTVYGTSVHGLIYSIAMNHYHLKFYLKNGLDLARVKQFMHGGTTFEYKKRYKMNYKEMWQSSNVIRIISEEMDWKVTGYIIGNLLKHKEVNTFEELKNNIFSSYMSVVKKYDEEFARGLVYSVIDVNEASGGTINIGELKRLEPFKPSAKAV